MAITEDFDSFINDGFTYSDYMERVLDVKERWMEEAITEASDEWLADLAKFVVDGSEDAKRVVGHMVVERVRDYCGYYEVDDEI